jgi:methionyl-tRNA formyltransferase
VKKLRKVVFFGTHELAVPLLDKLAELEVAPRLVVTRPEAGLVAEDGEVPPHPVRDWGQQHDVKVVRSRRAAEPRLWEEIAELAPDLTVVCDYGRPIEAGMLPASAPHAIEVQPSLLPDLRGPHALRGALAAGLKKTGVTVIEVAEEAWYGPVLAQEELEIDERETFGELLPRARDLACALLENVLQKIDRAKKNPRGKPQKDPKNIVAAPPIGVRHRKAPWSMEAGQIYDRLRAYSPPGLRTSFRYRPIEILSGMPMEWVQAPYGVTGTYLGTRQGKLAVLCGGSTVFGISRLRWPGEKALGASDFAFKEKVDVGDRFA